MPKMIKLTDNEGLPFYVLDTTIVCIASVDNDLAHPYCNSAIRTTDNLFIFIREQAQEVYNKYNDKG